MALKPQFAGTPLLGEQQIATANANRDGSGTVATLLTVGANGCRIDHVSAKAAVSTTPGMVRFYLRPNNAAPWRLWKEMAVVQTVVGAGVTSWEEDLDFPAGVPLPSGAELGASTHNAEAFNVFVHAGEF